MSIATGKFVIGLTGNIGTGKSVVRRMLEHLGAHGIDADALSHRAIAKGAPGYQAVIDHFGRWVLSPDGEIDRAKLARVVFADKEALAVLEGIIHPLVQQGVEWLIKRSPQRVVVIEAIKLLESSLARSCDSIWVAYAPPEVQMQRLMVNRKMSEAEARQRITAQSPQEKKLAAASVVIRNDSSYEEAWKQVTAAWNRVVPKEMISFTEENQPVHRHTPAADLTVLRGAPRDSEAIAGLLNRVSRPARPVTRDDIMAAFGEKAFLMLRSGGNLAGVLGWQVENLVARTVDLVLSPEVAPGDALPVLVEEMERASRNLQCEASLVFVPTELANEGFWKKLGYEKRLPQALSVTAWQEAANESMRTGSTMYFKQLRVDRVLRPI
ncbi:MAG: dephospho-CoA kinase [Anaerolineae bacterium]|nr:dephospho-CoA kinase [Anaerolineae bacterium]